MKQRRVWRRIWTFVVLAAVVIGLKPQTAEAGSDFIQPVLDARNGIVQVNVSHENEDGSTSLIQGGSGFLVGVSSGAQTIITNYNVVHLTNEMKEAAKEYFGVTELKTRIEVVVKRDVVLTATIENESRQSDFAILKIEQPIYDRTPLKIVDSNDLVETQDVYALGFYDMLTWYQDDRFYTSDDVNISKGTLSKKVTLNAIPYIQHSATINAGNAGGPLINSEGEVIGLNTIATEDEYAYSLQSNEIRDVLDALGIEYDVSGKSDPEEKDDKEKDDNEELETVPVNEILLGELKAKIAAAKDIDLDGFEDATVTLFKKELSDAESVAALDFPTDKEMNDAIDALADAEAQLVEKSGVNVTLLIVIGIIVLAVVIIIVVVIATSGKKKKTGPASQAAPSGGGNSTGHSGGTGGGSGMGHSGGAGGGSVPPTPPPVVYPEEGAGETSVLNEGAGETTVLSSQQMPSATLVRTKSNERIIVSSASFKIGKERRKVSYCISDNTSISRIHAEILCKNGAYYVRDNNSTNSTYVNGMMIAPGTERKLENNDKIKLSDEEFQFKL